ncbi:toprim domain-containing protein [Paracoccus denitrificans]|uniref:DnaB-like helicase C-terminal domain-containing protein n=1 Tax=Paracoccus denitrificans TaxID=266 RepID=UPI001E63A2A7|nr:DnaB-like helicase C-terminal domain-containing protein [Paracoccus denitrificans]UFS66955.1 toprim domain-containing protein [Paracoccus denitrificans]
MDEGESELISKGPCPECGSSDANALYSDGHAYCFVCHHYTPPDGEEAERSPRKSMSKDLLPYGKPGALPVRNLTETTCAKWGYTVSAMRGEPVQVAHYRDEAGNIVAQKVRTADKQFSILGDAKNMGLWGQHLWREKGKRVIITEGEIDAMVVSQLQDHRWPVVSLPKGAAGAKKAIAAAFEWLDRFEEIVLMFDNDDAGRAAVEEVGQLRFSPGKLKVARLALKDPDEMVRAKRGSEVIDAIFAAKTFRPDGIVSGADLWDALIDDETDEGLHPWPWAKIQEMLLGVHPGQVIMLTAGSGVGKTAIATEFLYWLHQRGETVGLMKLEEDLKRTARGLVGLALNKPAHLIWKDIHDEEKRAGFDATLGTGRIFLYDHFGSTDLDNLLAKIRFLAVGCGCRVILLDHISIVVSGMDDGDERRIIDNIMTALKQHAMELGIVLVVISHLKRPPGDKGHEEGAVTSLSQLRGSHSIAQLSDTVIGVERNQQGKRPNIVTLRVLKNRHAGLTGIAGWLEYNPETGRLVELHEDPTKEEETEEKYDYSQDESEEPAAF